MVLPHEYLDAKKNILNMRAGRNIDSRDLSALPKQAAQALLNALASEGIYIKQLGKGRWQRTNASSTKILAELQGDSERTAQAGKKPIQPTPYNHKNETKDMNSDKRAELDAAKARIKAEREAKINKIEKAVKYDELKAQLDGKPFNREASWKEHAAKLAAPKPAVKADISHSTEGANINKPSDRQLAPSDYLEPFGGIIGNAERVQFSDGRSISLSGVSAVSSVSLQAEAGTLSGSDLSFDGLSVQSHKVGNRFAISNELLEDNPNIVGSSVRAAQQALVRYLDDQAINGSDIVSGDNVKDHAGIAERSIASVAALALSDIHACLAAHDNEGEDLVLALNPSLFSSVIQDLLVASGSQSINRVGDQLYYANHRIVFSNALGGPSASASNTVLALAGSLKDGLVLAERSPLAVTKHDQILAEEDKCLYLASGRYGIAVRRPEALSRLQIL